MKMLRSFRDMMAGAFLTLAVLLGVPAAVALIPLPDVQGPFLGDQNANLYTVVNAISGWHQQRTTTGLTALAGGGQTGATQLNFGFNDVLTVVTGNDSL